MKDLTRRDFIKISIAAVIGTLLGRDLLSEPQNIPRPESSCGGNNGTAQKILVTYASQYGTTAEVAEAIAEVLCKNGSTAETKWIENVKDVANYDAVIIGSPIQYDTWMPEATDFVKMHQNALRKLPVAYFFTCLTLARQSKDTERQAETYANKLHALVPQVEPVSVGRFAGAIDFSKLSFVFRLLFQGFALVTGIQEGDYRDWNAIRAWAQDVHIQIQNQKEKILKNS